MRIASTSGMTWSGRCLRMAASRASPSSTFTTSKASATCIGGAPAYESAATTRQPRRLAEIATSLPSSPDPSSMSVGIFMSGGYGRTRAGRGETGVI